MTINKSMRFAVGVAAACTPVLAAPISPIGTLRFGRCNTDIGTAGIVGAVGTGTTTAPVRP